MPIPLKILTRLDAIRLDALMDRDRGRVVGRIKGLRRQAKGEGKDKDISAAVTRLEADVARSAALKSWRAEHRPIPQYPLDLPVSARRDEITAAIRKHPVVILAGETGSGKTTQLPKICLEAGRGIGAMIGHTQPRRIAARSLTERIAEELGGAAGEVVGSKVRFSDHTHERTFIKVMTDGILLAETQGDPLLRAYDTLIIDEAHERSLNIDFLLGYLKNLLPRRPDLKLIITSATIDTARFAQHFDNAPVISVEGRTYPVEIRYRPESDDGIPLPQRIAAAVDELSGAADLGNRDDILVFLPGERDIRDTAEVLRKHHPAHTEIIPLFARLSAAEQRRVFHPGSKRRIVLATNVAETSLTVPGIRYVIDPGTARISRYSTRAKVQRLPIERISQASANQRKGRCGRLSDGICIRLYDADDFAQRPEFTEPEIRRTNLAAVILRMLSLNLGDIEKFPFLEAPDRKQISDGFTLLAELGAVDAWRQLTPLGRQLATFNVDPRLARMIVAADEYGCVSEVLVIVSALSIPDPKERPAEHKGKADQAHARHQDKRSDFVAQLNLWRFFEENARHLSQNKLRKLCKENFLNYLRMREWHDIHRELMVRVKQGGLSVNQAVADGKATGERDEAAEYQALHKAVLAGLLGHVGLKDEKRDYQGARGGGFTIFPGSGVAKKPPKWVVAAELVETSRLYARTCAAIEPEWVEEVAGERLKRSYAEPHWQKAQGAVMAFERTALYGLLLCPKRTVHYGPIDPVVSREVFIRGALVPCELNSRAGFLSHNRELLDELDQRAAKSRSADVQVDESALFRFFDRHLPKHIHNQRSLDKWYRDASQGNPKLLHLSREDILPNGDTDPSLFPDVWPVAGGDLPLRYHFQLGHKTDGVTVTIPVEMLTGIDPNPFEWLVPGMIREKVGHLIKNLPKRYRKEFMPWPHWAERFVQAVPAAICPLTESLADFLRQQTGVMVPPEAWALQRLPEHHFMRFEIIGEDQKVLGSGRDLAALKSEFSGAAKSGFEQVPKGDFEREVTTWDFGPLPERVGLNNAVGYPALVDAGGRVALKLLESPETAAHAHRQGVVRLVGLQLPGRMRQLAKLAIPQKTCLSYAPFGGTDALRRDIGTTVLNDIIFADGAPIRTPEAFAACLERAETRLIPAAADVVRHAGAALTEYQQVHAALNVPKLRGAPEALDDIHEQFGRLLKPGFVAATPLRWLPHLARYLKGIRLRLAALDQKPGGDLKRMAEIVPLQAAYLERLQQTANPLDEPMLIDYGFLLEELRVSLFAQGLKTAQPVSAKRLAAKWKEIS